jgi:LPXTG-motif cell wall-anchored protein
MTDIDWTTVDSALGITPVTGGAMTMVLAVVGLVMTGVGFITRRIARI